MSNELNITMTTKITIQLTIPKIQQYLWNLKHHELKKYEDCNRTVSKYTSMQLHKHIVYNNPGPQKLVKKKLAITEETSTQLHKYICTQGQSSYNFKTS